MTNANIKDYVPPGGTGNQTETGGTGETEGAVSVSLVDTTVNPCGGTENLPGAIGESDCEVTPEPLPDFQSIIKDQDTGMYTSFSSEPTYDTDYHTLQLPVASDVVSNASFAIVANSTMKRRVTWVVEKVGDWPLMPTAPTGNSNEILLRQMIVGKNIELIGDQQTKVYTLRGEYIYGMVNPQSETMYMGVPPYVNDTVSDTAVPSSNFVSGITSP